MGVTDSVPVEIRRGTQLTSVQRGLWASQLRHPTEPVQNLALISHLDAAIDPVRFEQAFADVVAASDSLRSRVVVGVDERPVMVPSDEPAPTAVLSIARADATAWATERARIPIDATVRAYDSVLLQHEDGTSSWYLGMHHLVTDAVSRSIVFSATAAAYAGEAPSFASYRDWARALDDDESPKRDRAREHWVTRPAAPKIGALYAPISRGSCASRRVPIELSAAMLESVEAAQQQHLRMITDDLSWTAMLLTATAGYVHRLTGADHFALGLPVHNRTDPSTRQLVGPVMELFPVDVTIEPGDTFAALHKRTSRTLMRTLKHAMPGTAPSNPDFEAIVNVIPGAGLGQFGDIPTVSEWVDTDAMDPSNTLRVQRTAYGDAGPELALDVHNEAVPRELGHAPAVHFSSVLRTLVESPDEPIANGTLCSVVELKALERWGHASDGTSPESVVTRLARVLASTESVVLEDGDRRLTGPELWGAVDVGAERLRARGVGPGVRVGLEMSRSADVVIAILAVLAAGGSYVPLDPAQPRARLDRLAHRASCAFVLTDLSALRAPTGGEAGSFPSLDSEAGSFPSLDSEAYLLFTSGSTGEPKGVPISHRGLAGYLDFALSSYVTPGQAPVAPLFSALTFDLTVTSLFVPLLAGGRLVVVRDDGPAGMRAIAERTDINWAKATPSHLELLARLLPEDHCLATLIVGGEAFGKRLARRLWQKLPDVRIFNEYGPTEAVVGCMIHEARPDEFPMQADVPIGRPAPGVTLRIVDRYLEQVPLGAVGELCIAHAGLTAGYLDGDDAAFVTFDGTRFYRSGDLVRLIDPDTLMYLGRQDEQLKVGGVRLDPSEVEDALVAHPRVEAAAVRMWSPQPVAPSKHCVRCGLPDNVPGVGFDPSGVCDTCRAYDDIKDHAAAYFGTVDDLLAARDEARAKRAGDYDCLVLLSGGKDSTYTLFKMVELGFDVYALTLDNGFISEGAKENVRRSVAQLGVDHEFATTDAMNEIFRDSLDRYSNVCNGCYKTIYTLATNRAVALGIPVIVTGLSRGQLFETRLIPAQFSDTRFDPDAIDRAVLEARKAYHRLDDGTNRLLDTGIFEDDDVFDRIRYLDFYRYVDVELAEMLEFLDASAPWVRPADTGRSTNCLINAAGIHTHVQEQGYHNYAEPYAWDVRLGHKTRDEAMAELDDQLDLDDVANLLNEVGYEPRAREVLTAWIRVEGDDPPSPAHLRGFLADALPKHAIPSAFVVVDDLPMTVNGKLDAEQLPPPSRVHRPGPSMYVSPTTPVEATIVQVWERVLGVEPIGVDDDFFALGGDSLAALQMAVAISTELGTTIREELVFSHTTPGALASVVAEEQGDRQDREGPVARTPGTPPQRSFAEEAMLFEHRLAPDDPRYNIGHRFTVDGAVDPERFARALRAVVATQGTLRWTHAKPRQELTPDRAIELVLAPDTIGDAELAPRLHELQARRLDLDAGPLGRCLVQPMADGSTTVFLVLHHICMDAASVDLLWSDLDAAYSGRPLASQDIDYGDHAAWQAAGVDDDDRDFWLELVGPDPLAPLATVASQLPEHDGYLRRAASFSAAELRTGAGPTPFATSIGSLSTLLSRYVDGSRVGFGITASTRDHPATDRLVGNYLNTLPVVFDPGDASTPADVGDAAGRLLGQCLRHRAYPFASMTRDRRELGWAPLDLQVLLAYEEFAEHRLGGQRVDHEVVSNQIAVADLTFFVQIEGDAVVLAIEYRGTVVGEALAAAMLADFDTLIRAAIDHPGDDLQFPLPSESGAVIRGADLPASEPLVDVIFEHASARPDHIAVVAPGHSLSWSDLIGRAEDIARELVARGAPGQNVAVSMGRSAGALAAILGTLRAGASYVPLDADLPAERRRELARRSGAELALVGEAGQGLSPGEVVVHADGSISPSEATRHNIDSSRLPELTPDTPAYVIFTSGSTGEPRGVVVSHGELAASTAARNIEYPHAPERFLVVSGFGFDSSVAGLFWTMATGGTVVLPADREARDVDALLGLIDRAGVTHTLMVPSLYGPLLERGRAQLAWPSQVIVAGEACGPALVARHLALRPSSRLANEYGPTEATVWSTVHHCGVGDDPVPIGLPIAGTWAAVVDDDHRLRPVGVAGQLVVGGPGVTRGYLDDDDATSARFRSTGGPAAGRFFLTGDRAAIVDGTVHFLGRNDNQLNLGGVRLEPEEVERALTVPGVGAVVVVGIDDRALDEVIGGLTDDELQAAYTAAALADETGPALIGELRRRGSKRRLIAHVEAAPDVTEDHLEDAARQRLAPAARPRRYVLHAALPRTTNGKIDRDATHRLPVGSARTRARGTTGGEGPGGVLGEVLRLFREAVGDDTFEPDADFLAAGGTSLGALELVTELEDRFGVQLSVTQLFDGATPREIASQLPEAGRVGPDAAVDVVALTDVLPSAPLSFAQERLWVLEQIDPGQSVYNSATEHHLTGALDVDALTEALSVIVARHDVLRTRIETGADGLPVAVIDPPAPAGVIQHDLRASERSAAEALIAQEAARPFQLDQDLPYRVATYRLADAEWVLQIVFHHIAVDAWSVRCFRDELNELYAATIAGRAAILPELGTSHAALARSERERWRSGGFAEGLSAWAEELTAPRPAGLQPAVRADADPHDSVVAERTLTSAQMATLREVCSTLKVTEYMVGLGVTAAVLAGEAGEGDVLVGALRADRARRETRGVMGLLLNTVPLRLEVDADMSLAALAEEARRSTAMLFDHGDVPFDLIVDHVGAARDRTTPLLDAAFGVEHPDDAGELALAGTSTDETIARIGGAKFDLDFILVSDGTRATIAVRGRASLFDQPQVERLADRWLEVLAPGHGRQAGGTTEQQASPSFLPIRLAALAAEDPEAPAVISAGSTTSRGALAAAAQAVAAELEAAGVRAGDRVAVVAHRSVGTLAIMLGAWQVGAAYLPLDPAQPADRVVKILEDAQPVVVVADRPLAASLETAIPFRQVGSRSAPPVPRSWPGTGDDPAYLIYTSGSTGAPKGVEVSHRALAAFCEAAASRYPVSSADRILQFHSLAFGASIEETHLAFWAGAATVLRNDPRPPSLPQLFAECAAAGVTVLDLPTALWHEYAAGLDSTAPALPAGVRLIVIGGEAARGGAVRAWLEHYGATPLLNTYGPTETTVVVSAAELGLSHESDPEGVPIGAPLGATRFSIRDAHGTEVTPGEWGELWIGGPQLANGYVDSAAATAAAFVVADGERWYRSGDRARHRADGAYVVSGRFDDQIKLDGHRIEPGEIEHVLISYPGITAASIVVIRDGGVDALAAAVTSSTTDITEHQLVAALCSALPSVMVPTVVRFVPELPRQVGGKIDRGRVRALFEDPGSAVLPTDASAPSPAGGAGGEAVVGGGVVDEMALVWAELLGVGAPGLDDDFFALGGRSLTAVRLTHRVREVLGVEVAAAAVFDHSTLRAYSAHVADLLGATSAAGAGAGGEAAGDEAVVGGGVVDEMALVWAELLGVGAPGLDDDFFALGGRSLTAVRLTHRVREVLGVEVAAAAVFDHSTLRAYSVHVAEAMNQ